MTGLTEPEEITKTAYDEHGDVWAAKHGDEDFYAEERAKFQKFLPRGKLLEIGAGSGRDVAGLIAAGYDYTGTDISETLLSIARQSYPEQKFLNQSVYDLSFPHKFDGFWAAAVLLHLPKVRINEALQRISSVLEPNAIGFISMKAGVGDEIEEYNIDGTTLRRFYCYWNQRDFTRVLEKNGFAVLSFSSRKVVGRRLWGCYIVKNLGVADND